MKKLISSISLFTILMFIPSFNFAQIPNGGFEEWTAGNPNNWLSANISAQLSPIPVTKTTLAHSGNYALRADQKLQDVFGWATIWAGADAHGFPINKKYVQMTGYYKCSLVAPGDRFLVLCAITKGGFLGTNLGGGGLTISQSTDVYTKFSIPFTYVANEIPDWSQISFMIGGTSTIGSYYVIDDLQFEETTNINFNQNELPKAFKVSQNYPNPFNPSTIIRYELPKTCFVKLSIYDLLGRELITLVNEEKEAGFHETKFDASNSSSGIYYYTLLTESFVESKKLMVLK